MKIGQLLVVFIEIFVMLDVEFVLFFVEEIEVEYDVSLLVDDKKDQV